MKKEYEAWVAKLWEKYKTPLKLNHFRPTIVYVADLDARMECTFRYPYLDNDIKYGDHALEQYKENKKEAEATVVHEFCHMLTAPLYAKATSRYVAKEEIEDERERLTDHLANIIVDLVK